MSKEEPRQSDYVRHLEDECAAAQVLIGELRLELRRIDHRASYTTYYPYRKYRKVVEARLAAQNDGSERDDD